MKLLNDVVLTDFVIKVQDKEIHVHKAILAARSPVFAAMLHHVDTSESKTVRKFLKDLKQIFIYIGYLGDKRCGI